MTTETPTSGIARATAPSELGASESEHRDPVNLDALDLEAMEQVVEEDRDYLIIKRGLYYRPNILGYTGIKDNAGRYTLAEATDYADEVSGVSFVPEADAPDYSPACFSDIALSHLQGKHDALASALKSSQGEADAWKARALTAEAARSALEQGYDSIKEPSGE